MKKIIYKNVLKKFLTSFLLFMLLFYQIVPNVVWAENILFGTQKELSYDEWLKTVEEEEEDKEKEQEYKKAIEDAVKTTIKEEIFSGTKSTEQEEYAKKLLEKRGDKLIITGKLTYDTSIPDIATIIFKVESFKDAEGKSNDELYEYIMTGEEGMKELSYDDFKEYIGEEDEQIVDIKLRPIIEKAVKEKIGYNDNWPTDEQQDKLNTSVDYILNNRKGELKIYIKENKDGSYEITGVHIPGETIESLIKDAEDNKKKNESTADLGGMLLSPVFYLVNFVADAIISNLGAIMDPEAGSGITRYRSFS